MLTKSDIKVFGDLLRREIKPIKEDIVQIRKDQKLIVKFFDNEYLNLRERIERIESHLNLTAAN